MHLKSLEVNGFKSFGKKTTLQFTTPITGIVGPNGSGKSNVAEAFRFVLGEQSIKSLRGKKGEDLIFNGSKTIPRLNRASVKVTFDNSRKIFNLDFDEVTIERVVNRDSTNEYLINGSQVRLKDIIEHLAVAHIGASGHHIISQGEADRVLNASIKERKAMIEDALGLKVYQYKRAESERKLEKTKENMKQVESLRREISPHIRFLKKQVEKVEKAREMRGELVGRYKEYFKREELYLAHEKERIAAERNGPEEELAHLGQSLAEAKQMLSQATEAELLEKEISELDRSLNTVRREKEEYVRAIGRIEGMVVYEDRRKERERAQHEAEQTHPVPVTEIRSFSNTLAGYVKDIEVSSELAEAKSIASRIGDSAKSFAGKYAAVPEVSGEQHDTGELAQEKREAESKLAAIAEKERTISERYNRLTAEVSRKKDSGRSAEKAVYEIMARENELRSVLQIVKVRDDALKHAFEEYQRELTESATLVGREAFNINQYDVRDAQGSILSATQMLAEPRSVQEERRRSIERIKIRLEDIGGGSGEEVLKEYQDLTERDTFLERELLDLEKSAQSLYELIEELKRRLEEDFKDGIYKINEAFNHYFHTMFGGGHAAVTVVKEKRRKSRADELLPDESGEVMIEEEEAEEGIDIEVSLPHKKTKGLQMLSGGERALTSIALLFAISQVNPPPFIILDETDAALDEANSKKYGDMIEDLATYSQLIIITHNRETMSRSGVIYGVTMGGDGISKLLSIKFDEAVAVAK